MQMRQGKGEVGPLRLRLLMVVLVASRHDCRNASLRSVAMTRLHSETKVQRAEVRWR